MAMTIIITRWKKNGIQLTKKRAYNTTYKQYGCQAKSKGLCIPACRQVYKVAKSYGFSFEQEKIKLNNKL